MNERVIRGLYAVTPDESNTDRLATWAKAAVTGGARLLQYRNKSAALKLRLEQARVLVHVCRESGVPLIVNDHPDVALEVDADGVHLGREDGDIAAARRQLSGKLLGVSCYNEIARAILAERDGADYVAFGRFFPSVTKPGAIKASLELVAEAKRCVHVPIVAIGGITLERTPSLISAGIDAVAVISALSAADVRESARSFAALFDTGIM